ncbi:outer membrane beta-barrel protein [Ginsengibacter hankyongi]|uniref:Outer membrane beta-barrel protein n=1 Tax=Ginsengibacter hankyongi TaxID=2607284 RepID=A0A5J5IB40_9BACT|nr:DUF6089 family protein [Ginsengibacter hankyongi]KAA9035883.1 outer membrane beta-barrel protein [Ginsengibacter hankyongi]
MKTCLISLLLFSSVCKAQEWQVELMAGAAGYNGDLTQQRVSIKQLRPAFNLNLKYNSGDFLNFRAGIAYARIGADDKNNTSPLLKNRNLSFKSDIIELNAIAEINLFDPETFTAYPYIFGGVGAFYFNPFTFDNNNKKTYLHPLSTEGEGLKEFPDRKQYSLIQLCIPVGIGWKMPLNEKWDMSFEFGYRFTFTDYLDDVSKNYVDPAVLNAAKGPKSAELSYRQSTPLTAADVRGNPSINDVYYFGGIKLATSLNNLFKKH